jgi:hypothetical protein
MHDAAAGVRTPERSIGFGQNAFGALQVLPDIGDRISIDGESMERVGFHCRPLSGNAGPTVPYRLDLGIQFQFKACIAAEFCLNQPRILKSGQQVGNHE